MWHVVPSGLHDRPAPTRPKVVQSGIPLTPLDEVLELVEAVVVLASVPVDETDAEAVAPPELEPCPTATLPPQAETKIRTQKPIAMRIPAAYHESPFG
jgi:hypothetical protein